MFSLEDYINFLLNQVINKAIYYNKDITDRLINALTQFEVAPYKVLPDIPNATISLKYKHVFNVSKDKPVSVQLNDWFLYKFGYKHCSKCKQVKTTSDYSYSCSRWDKLYTICKKCRSCIDSERYTLNPEKIKNFSKNYRLNNPEKIKEYNKDYLLNNPDISNAKNAKRRASKVNATPKWLSKEQYKQILAFYTEAKKLQQETGVKYHVDHIIPLQGKNVCGLHVPWNLQVITATDNMKKYNN